MVEVGRLCGSGENMMGACSYQVSPSYVLAQKLKVLKSNLKKYNEEVFGNVGKLKKEMMEGLCEMVMIAE